jgi:hypothetical protein
MVEVAKTNHRVCRRRITEDSLKFQKKAAEMKHSWPDTKYFPRILLESQLVCILRSLDKAEEPYLGDMLVKGG